MINIAICDDESKELDCAEKLLTRYINENKQFEIKTYSFSAPLEMLSYIEEHGGFDLILLDIYMAGILGTDVARELRHFGDDVEIIFLTTSRDHSLDAFEVDAAQYLVKPYSEESFFSALNKVISRINVERRTIITFKTTDGISRISPRDVVFTETGKNNYQVIHTIQGKKLEVRMTSSEIFDLFSQNKFFIRCGSSLNFNLKYIRQISKEAITLDTGDCIAYPYRAYSKLKEDFLRFQMYDEE